MGDPLGFLKLQFVCCKMRNERENFSNRILNSVTVPRNVKGGRVGFFNIHSVAKFQKKLKGVPMVQSKNFRRKSHSEEKIQVKNTKIGRRVSFVCFRGSGRRFFCFGRGSGVSSMF